MKDYVKNSKNRFFLIKHKTKNFHMVIPYDMNNLSLSRLKTKMFTCLTHWNYFCTVTFALEEINKFISYDIMPSYYIKNEKFNIDYKMSGSFAGNTIIKFPECLENINFNVKSTLITIFINRIKNHLRKQGLDPNEIKYSWKYEEGGKFGRPHFHLILGTKMCLTCLYFLFVRFWKSGIVHINPIWNDNILKHYLHKEFTKHSKFRFFKSKKRWGFSRNCKFINIETEFEYVEQIFNSKKMYDIMIMNSLHISEEYSVEFYEGLVKSLGLRSTSSPLSLSIDE